MCFRDNDKIQKFVFASNSLSLGSIDKSNYIGYSYTNDSTSTEKISFSKHFSHKYKL